MLLNSAFDAFEPCIWCFWTRHLMLLSSAFDAFELCIWCFWALRLMLLNSAFDAFEPCICQRCNINMTSLVDPSFLWRESMSWFWRDQIVHWLESITTCQSIVGRLVQWPGGITTLDRWLKVKWWNMAIFVDLPFYWRESVKEFGRIKLFIDSKV